jgi:hypothetical protein
VNTATNVMPDLIRHPVLIWIPAFAGMTSLRYLIAGVITGFSLDIAPETCRMKALS